MNPDKTLRPWLIACGQHTDKGGILEAHPYRWPDESARREVGYFTYRVVSAMPAQVGKQRNYSAVGDYDAVASARQIWKFTVEIDVHNSQDGMNELARCCIAAMDDQDIINLLKTNGVAFKQVIQIVDLTDFTSAERLHYQHRLTCEFNGWLEYSHSKTNERITAIDTDDAIDFEGD